jgi:type VI secretion system protein ImpM
MTAISSPGLCGFYGKVPVHADFVGARLSRETVEHWDLWLQASLVESQERIGSRWQELFFAAPIWRFILPAGACGRFGLMGIVMPSVDSVGRCFPLMLGHELDGLTDPLGLMAGSGRWFTAAEDLALAALGEGFELNDLNRILPGRRSIPHPVDQRSLNSASVACGRGSAGAWMALPLASSAAVVAGAAALAAGWCRHTRIWPGLWWTAGAQPLPSAAFVAPALGLAPGLAITDTGLVPPGAFAALLDGRWAEHGWAVSAPVGPQGGTPRGAADMEDWERIT